MHFIKKIESALLLCLFPAALLSQENKVTFSDVAKSSGMNFRYTIGDDSYVNILESSGSGVTVFDYNGDGLMDIYMLNGSYIEGVSDKEGRKYRNSTDRLYRNDGNGRFTDVTTASGLTDFKWSEAAAPVDIDRDGDLDLMLLNYGPNRFFSNNGNGTFTDITRKAGLAGPDKLNGFTKWSIGASFFDFNDDGLLDVIVGNFLAFDPAYVSTAGPGIMPHPSEYKGQASMLYIQNADGSFTDVTKSAGLYYPDSKCMGITIYDVDEDGDLDIFQANDHQLNFLFLREATTFRESGVIAGVAANSKGTGTGSMHGTPGDIDRDGLIDLLVTDLDFGAMYRNRGEGLFEDVTERSGIAGYLAGKGSWGTALFDFDNDGDLDIVAANGTAEELVLQFPVLLENDGTGRFSDTGKQHGKYFSTKRSGRGLAVTDYDNDGDLDIIISHVDKEASSVLLRNDGGNRNHWLGICLKPKPGSNADIGAKVTLTAGGKKQFRINQWATGYLSNNDPRVHFGLGVSNEAESITVRWNNGRSETFTNVAGDRYITITEGSGISAYITKIK